MSVSALARTDLICSSCVRGSIMTRSAVAEGHLGQRGYKSRDSILSFIVCLTLVGASVLKFNNIVFQWYIF